MNQLEALVCGAPCVLLWTIGVVWSLWRGWRDEEQAREDELADRARARPREF